MASHASGNDTSVTESPAMKSVGSGAGLTSTRKYTNERKATMRQVKKRQARCRELPTPPGGNSFINETALVARGRPANPAYDELPNKRRKTHLPKAKKPARRPHREKGSKFEKALSLLDQQVPNPPVDPQPCDQGSVVPKCQFLHLPPEIRDHILRYLLRWPSKIPVLCDWSRVFPRSRPKLDLSILRTCRVLKEQGLPILFGENKFAYELRDPQLSHGHTSAVLEKLFSDCIVPINKYGHLVRHIQMKVDSSRLHFHGHRLNFENAIFKFLPGGGLDSTAQLHTLTLDVPAICNRWSGWPSGGGDDDVPICQYLRGDSKLIQALLKLQVQWVCVLARDRLGGCWETKIDMGYYVKDQHMRSEYEAARGTGGWDTVDERNDQDSQLVRYRTKDIEAMEKRWDDGVKKAVGRLRSLAWRIEVLACSKPNIAAIQHELWRKVDVSDNEDELVSLPSNWRESSYSTSTRSSRRTTSTRSNRNASCPPPQIPTKPKTKSKTTTEVTTETDLADLSIFNARDIAKDAKLLAAQQNTK
ncbi:hypothetical protein SAMD00023353_0600160 [Rosellinia necatrix]|uniref:F-box domain-containing protein n=1 Tax=Rosellinia necatrix TaxID=77044 RepID=A0A1S7ULJ7_ROSNE|nr:hypothetical protein SAMD00023353_0600160 [Rosellinia necatrix]